MIDNPQFKLAKEAATRPLDVTSAPELARAAKTWKQATVLGLDTEFIRERTYFAQLALIQVSDGQSVWLIDPLAIDELEPFVEMLKNPQIIKVLHAPSEDLELMQYLFSTLPQPMFDTQLAATAVGQPLQLSYNRLVEWLLDEQLDSSLTRSNWLRRPLTGAQRHYASLDVAYLPLLHDLLLSKLQASGRIDWHREDCERMCAEAALTPDPDQLYLRTREAFRMNQEQLNVLQRLVAWRDMRARAVNRPRKHVLTDKSLMEIIKVLPARRSDLRHITDLHPRFIERQGKAILQLVKDGLNADDPAPKPPEPLGNRDRKLCAKLQEIVQRRAKSLAVERTWLATRKDLESLIRSKGDIPDESKLSGWRKAEIIADLVTTLNN